MKKLLISILCVFTCIAINIHAVHKTYGEILDNRYTYNGAFTHFGYNRGEWGNSFGSHHRAHAPHDSIYHDNADGYRTDPTHNTIGADTCPECERW